MVIGYFALWADRNLTVYDDKFKILDYSISIGKNHTMYQGNQTAGRIRTTLRDRFGLKFIDPPSLAVIRAPECRVRLLRYTGDFPFDELDGLKAILTNGKEICKELIGVNMATPGEQAFVRGYILPWLSENNDSLRIELKLKSADDPVACLSLGKLYRRHRRINSDK